MDSLVEEPDAFKQRMKHRSMGKVLWEYQDVFANLSEPFEAGKSTFYTNENAPLLPGKLRVIERRDCVCIEWKPNNEPEQDWHDVTDEIENGSGGSGDTLKKWGFSIPLMELRSFKYRLWERDSVSQAEIKFICSDGTSYVPLFFRNGGSDDFVALLQRFIMLKRSAKEADLIMVSDPKAEQLQRSVSLLLNEGSADFLSKFISNPYTTALSSLGRVTNFVADKVNLLNFNDLSVDEQEHCAQELKRQAEEADRLHVTSQDSFQFVSKGIDLPARPDVPRGPLLSAHDWKSRFLQPDGSVQNVHDLRQSVFRGGVQDDIRKEVWKFLLGYYPYASTYESRMKMLKDKRDDYFRMKLQWKSIAEDQENRFVAFRDRKALVDKDVARTDRSHRFFSGDDNPNLMVLYDVLMTYCMYNFDLGYVQGMSDLLGPLMIVMENEVDSFWCFVGFMDRVLKNFEMDQQAIKTQLMQLRDLLMVINPNLLNYLETHDSDNMFFCFRWILILFKREFCHEDILLLWEVFFTDLPCKNFHLLFCLAVIDSQERFITENRFGFTEILKHVNDLSMRIGLEENLKRAEGIYHQLAAIQNALPPHICDILGFCSPDTEALPPIHVSQSHSPNGPNASNGMDVLSLSDSSSSSSVGNGSLNVHGHPAIARQNGSLKRLK